MHHLQTRILEETTTHICPFVHTTDFVRFPSNLAAFEHGRETVNPGFIEHPANLVLRVAVMWCGLSRNIINDPRLCRAPPIGSEPAAET
jgi:hypothetical protein